MIDLSKDVKYIKGVGPERVKSLNKLGIYTLEDLITYYPRTYEDRSKPKTIGELVNDEEALIEAVCVSRISEIRIRKNMTIYKLTVRDETDSCQITWFNMPYLKAKFKYGQKYKFFGKVKRSISKTEMMSPIFEEIDTCNNTGKIIPIYPSIYELTQNTLKKIINNGLEQVIGELEETLPDYILKEYNLIDINKATKNIHFPENFEEYNKARKRLVFEELLVLQLALLNLKNNYSANKDGICFDKNVHMQDVIDTLPYKLTNAQTKVLEEIDNDMESNKPMNRLLQGDVGCRKNSSFNNRKLQGRKIWLSSCNNGTNCNTCKTAFREL